MVGWHWDSAWIVRREAEVCQDNDDGPGEEAKHYIEEKVGEGHGIIIGSTMISLPGIGRNTDLIR